VTRQFAVKLLFTKIEPACGEHLPAPSAEDAVAFDAQGVNYLFRRIHALKYSGKKKRVNQKKVPLDYCNRQAIGPIS
jgi:hypothetical protein